MREGFAIIWTGADIDNDFILVSIAIIKSLRFAVVVGWGGGGGGRTCPDFWVSGVGRPAVSFHYFDRIPLFYPPAHGYSSGILKGEGERGGGELSSTKMWSSGHPY